MESPSAGIAPGAFEARSDDELIGLARGGERVAFDALVRRHQASALKVAGRYLADGAAARDACQNAFVELYRALPRYRPSGTFEVFFRKVLLNQCRMVGRSTQILRRAVDAAAVEPVQRGAAPDQLLLERERQHTIERHLSQLTDKLREVVVLRYAGGHSLDEVAAILELPVGTVKSRLFAAMQKLHHALGEPP